MKVLVRSLSVLAKAKNCLLSSSWSPPKQPRPLQQQPPGSQGGKHVSGWYPDSATWWTNSSKLHVSSGLFISRVRCQEAGGPHRQLLQKGPAGDREDEHQP